MTRHCKPMTDLTGLVRTGTSSVGQYKKPEPVVKRDVESKAVKLATNSFQVTRSTAKICGVNYAETR